MSSKLMNERNIETFDNLFEHEGWIITKNERGKVKVASCEQDETNIYEKSRDWKSKPVEQTKIDTFKLPSNELYKTARFFIRDLLNCERQDTYFVCKNIPYLNVFICGTVVSLYEQIEKYSIIVDDGTSCIKCIIEKEYLNSLKDNSSDLNNSTFNESLKQGEKNVFLQAAILTRSCIKRLHSVIPSFDELEPGDIVKIFGAISEYNCNRYIFIKKIMKEPKETTSHVTYLKETINLYSEKYDN